MSWNEQRPRQRASEKAQINKKLYLHTCRSERKAEKQRRKHCWRKRRVEQGNRAASNSVLGERDMQGQKSTLVIHDSLQGRRDHLLHVRRRGLELERAEKCSNEDLELQYSYIS